MPTKTMSKLADLSVEELKDRLPELDQVLVTTTDSTVYDNAEAEKQEVIKQIRLKESRIRADAEAAAAAARQAEIDQFETGKADLAALNELRRKVDDEIMETMHAYSDAFKEGWDLTVEAVKLSHDLFMKAQELGVEGVQPQRLTVCNALVSDYIGEAQASTYVMSAYANSYASLKDAKAAGQRCPDRPGLDWFTKGDGGQFWPRDEPLPLPEIQEEEE